MSRYAMTLLLAAVPCLASGARAAEVGPDHESSAPALSAFLALSDRPAVAAWTETPELLDTRATVSFRGGALATCAAAVERHRVRVSACNTRWYQGSGDYALTVELAHRSAAAQFEMTFPVRAGVAEIILNGAATRHGVELSSVSLRRPDPGAVALTGPTVVPAREGDLPGYAWRELPVFNLVNRGTTPISVIVQDGVVTGSLERLTPEGWKPVSRGRCGSGRKEIRLPPAASHSASHGPAMGSSRLEPGRHRFVLIYELPVAEDVPPRWRTTRPVVTEFVKTTAEFVVAEVRDRAE